MRKNEIDNMVIRYRSTNDRKLLDKIAEDTIKLIYKFGKSYKIIPKQELNSIFGVALMKALRNWNEDGQAFFTSYLSAIIQNQLKVYIRDNIDQKQKKFENGVLQVIEDEYNLDAMFISEDESGILEYEVIVNDIINGFHKDHTRKALRMYVQGNKAEHIVKELKIGRTMFFYDLKIFKEMLRGELENANIQV